MSIDGKNESYFYYDQGVDACINGLKLSDNPYQVNSNAKLNWSNGFLDQSEWQKVNDNHV